MLLCFFCFFLWLWGRLIFLSCFLVKLFVFWECGLRMGRIREIDESGGFEIFCLFFKVFNLFDVKKWYFFNVVEGKFRFMLRILFLELCELGMEEGRFLMVKVLFFIFLIFIWLFMGSLNFWFLIYFLMINLY